MVQSGCTLRSTPVATVYSEYVLVQSATLLFVGTFAFGCNDWPTTTVLFSTPNFWCLFDVHSPSSLQQPTNAAFIQRTPLSSTIALNSYVRYKRNKDRSSAAFTNFYSHSVCSDNHPLLSFPFRPVSFPIRQRRTSTSNLHVQFIRFKYTRRSYEQKNTTGFSLNAGRYHSTTERWPLSSWFNWTYKELPTHELRFHKRQVPPIFAFNNQTQATSAAVVPFWRWRWNQRKNLRWLPHLLTVHLWVYSAVYARWFSVPMRRLEGI